MIEALIPCYNDYPSIYYAIESIKSQVDKVVVVDSSDDFYTSEFLKEISKSNDNIEVFKSEKYLDWVEARNILIELSKADIQLWMDANDVFHDHCINELAPVVESLNIPLTFTGLRSVWSFHTATSFYEGPFDRSFYHIDPCHFICRSNDIKKWIYKDKKIGFKVGYRNSATPVFSGERLLGLKDYYIDNVLRYRHLINLNLLERIFLRSKFREFISIKLKEKLVSSPREYYPFKKQNFKSIEKLLDHEQHLGEEVLESLPNVLKKELIDPKYIKFEFDGIKKSIKRKIYFKDKLVEEINL